MKEKTIRSSLAIPAWLFVMANVLYQELALHPIFSSRPLPVLHHKGDSMKEKTIRSSLAIPAWLFVMANVLYQELALHLFFPPGLCRCCITKETP